MIGRLSNNCVIFFGWWAGLQVVGDVLSQHLSGGPGERKYRASTETGLDHGRQCMEGHGHVDIQHMALVDPHRTITTVRNSQTHVKV